MWEHGGPGGHHWMDMDHSRGHSLREQESVTGAQLRDRRPRRTKQRILWGTEALKETRWPSLAGRCWQSPCSRRGRHSGLGIRFRVRVRKKKH